MKKLEIALNSCANCPYHRLFVDWYCTHSIYSEDMRTIAPGNEEIDNGFPEWCPIQDQDPGVRVGLTAMVVRNGKILLGERFNTETANGMFAYPGGRMDYGETPENGVVREVLEETGLVVNKERMYFLTSKNEYFPEANKHYVSLVFIVEDFEGEPETKEPNKCKGWDWYDPFDLPENTFWAIKDVIAENYADIKAIIIANKIVSERK